MRVVAAGHARSGRGSAPPPGDAAAANLPASRLPFLQGGAAAACLHGHRRPGVSGAARRVHPSHGLHPPPVQAAAGRRRARLFAQGACAAAALPSGWWRGLCGAASVSNWPLHEAVAPPRARHSRTKPRVTALSLPLSHAHPAHLRGLPTPPLLTPPPPPSIPSTHPTSSTASSTHPTSATPSCTRPRTCTSPRAPACAATCPPSSTLQCSGRRSWRPTRRCRSSWRDCCRWGACGGWACGVGRWRSAGRTARQGLVAGLDGAAAG